jgi:hypothetical protein
MRLLTLGDSFTYGQELVDRSHAWPNLVAAQNGYKLTNLGIPGSGNTNMVRNCIERIDQYDIVIVAWSHFARIEFSDEKGTYDTWPGHRGIVFTDDVEFRKDLNTYITKHYNDSYLYRQYLINIILIQNYLKSKNKQYVMLDAFGNTQISERNKNEDLISQIDAKFYLGWPYQSMMEWTYGCMQGPNGHFLEDGHKKVAEKINEHIRHLGWVS